MDIFGVLDWYNIFIEIIYVLIHYWSLNMGESLPPGHGPMGSSWMTHLRKVEVICVILYYLFYIFILANESNVLIYVCKTLTLP